MDYAGGDDFSGAKQASSLATDHFTGFSTDVTGMLADEPSVLGFREAMGGVVGIKSDTPGDASRSVLAIRTNATDFNSGGKAMFDVADLVLVPSPDGPIADLQMGLASIDGTFQPAGRPNGPPTGVPLPPAVFTGLGMLLGGGLIARIRRGLPRGTP